MPMTNLPRIRRLSQPEPWLTRASLVGYPLPGIGIIVDIYDMIDGGYLILPVMEGSAAHA